MSVLIPTDVYGRAIGQSRNLLKLPFTTISHTTPQYFDEKKARQLFIDAAGDKMEGILDMQKHRITNVLKPTNDTDCANKAYVDLIKQKVMESISKDFRSSVATVSTRIAKNEERDRHLHKFITEVKNAVKRQKQTFIIKTLKSKLVKTRNISTVVLTWNKDHTITKNLIVLEILIETDNGVWLDVQNLNYRYGFFVYEMYNKQKQRYQYHISTETKLPDKWPCNLLITCLVQNLEEK